MMKRSLRKTPSNTNIKKEKADTPSTEIPQDLWTKCVHCGGTIYRPDVKSNYYICPKCKGYFRLKAFQRIRMTVDKDSFIPWDADLKTKNPLQFTGYLRKLEETKEKTGLDEAVITGEAEIDGHRTVFGVCDARFLMGSMGEVVGEKITRAVERATKDRLPVILFCCSGGARMQEGIVSLMQMAKTSAALKRHSDAGLLYVTVLTDPTTGGVTASFAMLGDVILAEPGALIGFAGPRVIEQTIKQKLPEGFQRAEFLLEHGFIDQIVERQEIRNTLAQILAMHEKSPTEAAACTREKNAETAVKAPSRHCGEIPAWEIVERSRQTDRLTALDYMQGIFTGFQEFHGDRYYQDDGAVIGGIAWFQGRPVTVIGQQKGRNLKDNLKRNFGMPSPDGYRKALRLMKQAEKFGRPIICFVDTPGAFCGLEAEERGQGRAIADNLFTMSSLKVPVLSLVIGEGGSGGALAMAVADEVWMMENAIYSILSPEGFASILWKDSKRAGEASAVMKITADDLLSLGIIEKVIPEAESAGQNNVTELCGIIEEEIAGFLSRFEALPPEELAERRYQRFRKM